MPINIPETKQERIVIVGAGFGGFTLARKLSNTNYQVVLIDRNNFHQFQPLFYQVAMAGLEPSAIVFPLRKAFQKCNNLHLRVAELERVDFDNKQIHTDLGLVNYDKLILSYGAKTNFFNNKNLEKYALSIKSIGQSLLVRNQIFEDLERALITRDYDSRQGLIDIVIVGGGPTGVELAGALAEMKTYILPKDYAELDPQEVDIYLVQSGDKLLPGMSEHSSAKALKFLKELGVEVKLNTRVTDYDGKFVTTRNGQTIRTDKVVWAAGVTCPNIEGMPESVLEKNNRLKVDQQLKVIGIDDVYAIGDIAKVIDEDYPYGHPQVAQPAIQQAKYLAKQILKPSDKTFSYKDKGSMATIGRNKAVADIGSRALSGFFAWALWLFVHLFALVGVKNKVIVLLNWIWNYFTYDQSLRLIIRPEQKRTEE